VHGKAAVLAYGNVKTWVFRMLPTKGVHMSNKDLFIERRPEGDFAVRRANSERASAVEETQSKAIARARELDPKATVLVERVRHTTVGKPDKWRKP
jgi:hypothetical protein